MRADVGAAELAGGGRWRCARVGEEGTSEKGSASEKRLSSGTGATRRGGDDDDGEREVRRRFGGKRLSADLEGDEAYIEPLTFCHGSYYQP
jgi:hypothetical protein